MWLVRVALQRPYTFIVMAMLIVILGVLAALGITAFFVVRLGLRPLARDLFVETPLSVEVETVSAAPPQLDTTNATVGATIENEDYTQLPLEINGSPRNPTALRTRSIT